MAKQRVEEEYKGDSGGLRGCKREIEGRTKGNGIRRGGGLLGISSQIERLYKGNQQRNFDKGHRHKEASRMMCLQGRCIP